jgi:predicted phage terminase large subunit-like protein
VIEPLQNRVTGIVPVTPVGGKYARAQASAYSYEASEVWLPSPEWAPWISDFVERHVAFTGEEGGEDDEVDAESQMIARWDGTAADQMGDALERARAQFGFIGRRR